MGYYRVITEPRNIISWSVFFGVLLIEIGLAWFIGTQRYALGLPSLTAETSFELMFGALLLAHGLLKRGHPYQIGKLGTFLGVLFVALGTAGYYGNEDYTLAILFVLLGIVVIAVAARGKRWH